MARSEIKTVTFSAPLVAGSFVLTIGELSTAGITDFSAAGVQAAIEAIDPMYVGKVLVELDGDEYRITFDPSLGDLPDLYFAPTDLMQAVDATVNQTQAGADAVPGIAATLYYYTIGLVYHFESFTNDTLVNVAPTGGSLTINLNSGNPFTLTILPTDSESDINNNIQAADPGTSWVASNSLAGGGGSGNGWLSLTNSDGFTWNSPTNTLTWTRPATAQIVEIDLNAVSGTGNFIISENTFSITVGDPAETVQSVLSDALGAYACYVNFDGEKYTITSSIAGATNVAVFEYQSDGSTLGVLADDPSIVTVQDGSSENAVTAARSSCGCGLGLSL